MLVECDNCGAPLSVRDGQPIVQCSYCKASIRVQTSRTVAAQTPTNWRPPPTWHPPPHLREKFSEPLRYQSSGGAGAGIGIAIAGAVLATVGVAVAVSLTSRGGMFQRSLDPNAPPTLGTFDPDAQGRGSFSASGTAGGGVDGHRIGANCRGYMDRAPTILVRLASPRDVALTTRSNTDLTMAVRTPSGNFLCDDDSGEGQNPLIRGTFTPGVYAVWVGTFAANTSATYTLVANATVVGTGAGGLAADAAPNFGTIALDTQPVISVAGVTSPLASIDLSTISNCHATISSTPDFVIRTAQTRTVTLRATSQTDTVMAIRLTDGTMRCDDDSGGAMNPRIETTLLPGAYPVWIGTYGRAGAANYTFEVMSTSAVQAAATTLQAGPPSLGEIELDTSAGLESRQGPAGGPVDATTLGSPCRGYVPMQPQYTVRSSTRRVIRIDALSPEDTTLVVRDAAGEFHCDDDSGGNNNPRLQFALRPGVTDVWVGTYVPNRRALFQLVVTPIGRGH